ncbi:YwiC-like family protein [Capilliphycus salinus ALCB114379]|uniref:YwiC-like family protein n=1 Tax=Capilliphycus salinus TaxID=2768948 RepID=UPI0039A67DD7
MTVSTLESTPVQQQKRVKPNLQAWYRPTVSPEQGILLILFGSVITGSALAQHWTTATTLAGICAFFALQAEYPLILQIKQRRSWKPRFVVWTGLYGTVAGAIALMLYLQTPELLWVYLGAAIALLVDATYVYYQKQKSILNELNGFAAICLAAPLAYTATTGHLSLDAVALWILNTLFFGSAVFTFKLRKKNACSRKAGSVYHTIASAIVILLYGLNCLSLVTALAFAIAVLKFILVCWRFEWYRTTRFHHVAIFETRWALMYIAIAAISVLPAHLPAS